MTEMLTISLKGLRFYAFLGVYPEEKIIGNQFEIDLDIECIPVSGTITSISDTVNYTDLYLLIRTEMKKPTELLETFLMQTVEKIHLAHPSIVRAEMTITKFLPPMPGFEGKVCVKYAKEFQRPK